MLAGYACFARHRQLAVQVTQCKAVHAACVDTLVPYLCLCQVLRMVRELAALHKQRQQEQAAAAAAAPAAAGAQQQQQQRDPRVALLAAAEDNATNAAQRQKELSALRQQLRQLRTAALSDVSPGSSPGRGASVVATSDGEDASLGPGSAVARQGQYEGGEGAWIRAHSTHAGAADTTLLASPEASPVRSKRDDGSSRARAHAAAAGGPVSADGQAQHAVDGSSRSKGKGVRSGKGGRTADASGASAAAAAAAAGSMAEVRRLLREKAELLRTGLYRREDALVVQIDARIQQLVEAQQQEATAI